MTTRVLIVHPDPDVREELARALAEASDLDLELEEVGELTSGARLYQPDVVVTSLPRAGAGNGDGRATFPETLTSVPRVVVLDDPTEEAIQDALRLGPAGVLLTDSPPALLAHAVQAALQDAGVVLDQSISPLLAEFAGRGLDLLLEDEADDDLEGNGPEGSGGGEA